MLLSLFAWWKTLGTVNVNTVSRPPEEAFYWLTITFSQTLGTALGDWSADPLSEGGWGLGYSGGALVFGAGLTVLAILYFTTRTSRVFLFWAAFILTRPLGATVGDFLDKPLAKGGLDLSRPIASAVLAAVIVLLIVLLPQRPGKHPGEAAARALNALGATVGAHRFSHYSVHLLAGLPRSLPVEMLDWTNPAFHPLAGPDAAGRLPVEGPGFRIELDQAVIDRHGVKVPLRG